MARSWNPNTADWLVASRKARGWKQDAVVDLLARAQGVTITRSWLSRIENGEPFSEDLLAAFVALYGSEPRSWTEPEAPATPDARYLALLERMAAAADRQAAALELQAALLAQMLAHLTGGEPQPDPEVVAWIRAQTAAVPAPDPLPSARPSGPARP